MFNSEETQWKFTGLYLGLKTKQFCNIRWCIWLQKFDFVALNFDFCIQRGRLSENFKMYILRTGHQNPELNNELKLADSS